jgi:hypothetical protein
MNSDRRISGAVVTARFDKRGTTPFTPVTVLESAAYATASQTRQGRGA